MIGSDFGMARSRLRSHRDNTHGMIAASHPSAPLLPSCRMPTAGLARAVHHPGTVLVLAASFAGVSRAGTERTSLRRSMTSSPGRPATTSCRR